jgi:uncharacterized SAM-binding protein YcdF (DUF218 family)
VPTPRVRRTLLIAGTVVAAVVVVAVVVVNLKLFVWPSSDDVGQADAVVVLAGGDGERLDHALDLMDEGVARTLVASTGPDRLCGAQLAYEVICFLPDPSNTRGEVEQIAELAEEHGWQRLVLVTSTYHATRAELLLDRCYPGAVAVSAAAPNKSTLGWLGAITHEWGGLAEAALERSC